MIVVISTGVPCTFEPYKLRSYCFGMKENSAFERDLSGFGEWRCKKVFEGMTEKLMSWPISVATFNRAVSARSTTRADGHARKIAHCASWTDRGRHYQVFQGRRETKCGRSSWKIQYRWLGGAA